tara:strand:- start:609 stop:1505 length:897 start_codon:yes stop_codon:yes gene_type:complete
MTEEERRRRLGIQTTPEYEDYLIRVAQARAAGLPDPAPLVGVPTKEAQPTSRAAMMQPGEQRLIRPYVDPRDEMIASSPALVRPAYSILDRMLRPGRAGMADRMNREYMEGLLKRDADQRMSAAKLQEQQAKAAYADIERRAAEGDTDALDQIEALSKARYAGRGTGSGNESFEDLLTRLGLQGGGQASGDRPPMIPTPEGARMPMRRAEPANPYANLSAEDARALYDSRVAEIDTAAQQQIDSAPLSSVAPVNLKNLLFDSDVPSGGPADTVRQAEALKALNLRQLREYHPNVAPQL